MLTEMCRTCLQTLSNTEEAILIDKLYKDKYNLWELFIRIVGIKLEYTDDMSKLVCESCAEKLIGLQDFSEMCIASHRKMQEMCRTINFKVDKTSDCETKNEYDCYEIWLETSVDLDDNADRAIKSNDDEETDNSTNCSEIIDRKNEFKTNERIHKVSAEYVKKLHNVSNKIIQIDDAISNRSQSNEDQESKHENKGNSKTFLKEKSHKSKEPSNDPETSPENSLQCTECDKSYETISGLRKHRQNIHHFGGYKNIIKAKPKPKINCTIKKCPHCSKGFETVSGMRRHLVNFHKTNSLPTINCTFCSEKFYLSMDLEKHILASHQDFKEALNDGRWQCGACGETFKTRKTMHDHRLYTGHKTPRRPQMRSAKRENGTEGNFQCDICKRFYTTKRKIRHHMEIHDSEKKKQKFLCTVCGIWLSSNHILESHYRAIHLGEKRYKCPYCDRLFSFRQDLKVHTNRHEGIRPYACKQCPKTFFLSSNLKEHMESIHLNAKRHICTVCNKAFNRKGNLKLHTYTHTRQSPHQCPTCGAGFSRKYKLNEHVEHCKIKSDTNIISDECNTLIEFHLVQ